MVPHERTYRGIADYGRLRKRGIKYETGKIAAPRQSHVGLSVRETCRGVYDGTIESEPLTLVDCYGPGSLKRKLPERSILLFIDFPGGLIDDEPHILPLHRLHLYVHFTSDRADGYRGVGQFGDVANHAVIEAARRLGIVLDKHHLRAPSLRTRSWSTG